ncbi:MAG: PrsW family intramembrane metalloprotease [Lachnospiraceae bacterium]|nr:PrsW family intramembrane metalloprotease [Lachnospiraceae bacterium]
MRSMENIYICLASPIAVSILCLRREWRKAMIFILAGMSGYLMAAYVTSFFARVAECGTVVASHTIAPAVEEIIKFLPILFYLLVFEPKKRDCSNAYLLVAVGFATFENVCFMTYYGASDLLDVLIRGFGTGAMHELCCCTVALGIFLLWDTPWLRLAGTFGFLCTAITFHAIFNIVVSGSTVSMWVGSAIPISIFGIYLAFFHKRL